MKICFTFILAIWALMGTLPAQNFPFPTQDAAWIASNIGPLCVGGGTYSDTWKNFLWEDTIINGAVYSQLWHKRGCSVNTPGSICTGGTYSYLNESPILIGGLRMQDNKVYYRKFGASDSQINLKSFEPALRVIPRDKDILLYDFDWELGDTFYVEHNDYFLKYVVKQISTTMDGRKSFGLNHVTGIQGLVHVIEGAGSFSLFGLYYPVAYIPEPTGSCATVLYGTSCTFCGLVDAPEPPYTIQARVFPNPSTDVINITADPDGSPYQLHLYDLHGRKLIENLAFSGSGVLSVKQLQSSGWVLVTLQSAKSRAVWAARTWIEP